MKYAASIAGVIGVLASAAFASPVTSEADPALADATLVDFESETVGTYYAYQGGYTTLVGNVNLYAARLYIEADPRFAGLYNTRGAKYLTNGAPTRGFNFTFASPVSAFGFNFGASDVAWTLTAYDANDTVIETVIIPPTFSSNAGNFFGVAAPGIASATLSQGPGIRTADVVFVDNLKFK